MYYYFFDRNKKEVIEMSELTEANIALFKAFNVPYYDHFPYEEAGYEDPYSFLEDYTLIKLKGHTFVMGDEI
jgi:hypothetical protein